MDSVAIKQVAVDKLGGWRVSARAELRALSGLLEPGERITTMGMGTLGKVKGRLCVATDRRLLLLNKTPLRPLRCDSIPIERLRSLRLVPKGAGGELSLDVVEGPIKLEVFNYERAQEIARALSAEGDRQAVSTPHSGGAKGSPSSATYLIGSAFLIVMLGTWVAVALWAFEVLAFLPGLMIVVAGTAAQYGLRWAWRRAGCSSQPRSAGATR